MRREIVGQNVVQVVGQSRLAATLRMPNDPRSDALIEPLTYRQGREQLLVAHDVLLIGGFDLSVNLTVDSHVGNPVLDEEQQPLWGHHRSEHPVRWRVLFQIRGVLRGGANDLNVVVIQDPSLDVIVDLCVGELGMEGCLG